MTTTDAQPVTNPSRLTWVGAAALPEAARNAIMGPGARFEIVVEDVLGVPTEVFAQRHRSLRESMEAARVNYADRIYLMKIYDKGSHDDLDADEKKNMKNLAEDIRKEPLR